MVWRADDPTGTETAKICWEIPKYTRGKGLEIGCGAQKTYPHFIGVDNGRDAVLFNQKMKPDILAEAEDLSMFASQSMDFVFSSHTLEHLDDDLKALKEWWRVLKPKGHLTLYLPHKLFYPNKGQKGANPDHRRDYLPDDVISLMKQVGSWDLIENQERNEDREYSFLQVYKKL